MERDEGSPLAPAIVTRTRFVVPFYTLEDDIRLPDGRLLYAKGYTFNPLTYVSLPQRLIVVPPRDLDWAMREAAPGDDILLTAGSAGDSDAITLGESTTARSSSSKIASRPVWV
jgi:conjugal transfer pilus assembly protein TraW